MFRCLSQCDRLHYTIIDIHSVYMYFKYMHFLLYSGHFIVRLEANTIEYTDEVELYLYIISDILEKFLWWSLTDLSMKLCG